jgi:hypothetical protein
MTAGDGPQRCRSAWNRREKTPVPCVVVAQCVTLWAGVLRMHCATCAGRREGEGGVGG